MKTLRLRKIPKKKLEIQKMINN